MVYLLIKCRLFLILFLIPVTKEVKIFSVYPVGSAVKNLFASAGVLSLIPGLGRSPGEGNGNPLQYSCLGNPMERGAQWAAVSGATKIQT